MVPAWPAPSYEDVAGDLRHAARAHPGARQAGGRARPARAAAAACGAASDRTRLGDGAAARARRLGRAGRRARPATPRGGGRAQRRAGRAGRAHPATARSARSPARCSAAVGALGGPVEIDPAPQEVPWSVPLDEDEEHAPTTRRRSPVLRRRDPRRARARRVPRALSRTLDAGQRVVGLVRPRGEPVLRPAGRSAVGRLHHAQRDGRAGGRRRLVARRRRYAKAAFYAYAHPAPEGSPPRRCPRPRRAGMRRWASTSWTGTMFAAADPHAAGARVRPLGVPPCLRGVRVGRARRQRRRDPAAGQVIRTPSVG